MWSARSDSAKLAEKHGLRPDQIILSAKVSGVQDLIDVYRMLAARCQYPLHLGLTEAGMGAKGIVASSAAMAVLLQEGIGDTIRVSLTPAPGGDRTEEVRVAQQILQSLGIRSFTPQVTACPGCGRTTSTFFQEMAEQIQTYLREQMLVWKRRYTGVEEMKVAVMGCVVNGPGESKHASLGISLPGTFEEPKAPVYVDGRLFTTLKGDKIVAEFIKILDDYVESHYAAREKGSGRLGFQPSLRTRERSIHGKIRFFLGHSNKSVATNAPAICAKIKPGTSAGRMPEKVSVMERATETAGFANDVDAVNQYAATM